MAGNQGVVIRIIPAPQAFALGFTVWPSTPPASCPFKPSEFITGIGFTRQAANYGGADTFYPSWASDDNMYSPWADGDVEGVSALSFSPTAATGQVKIVGDDPQHLRLTDVATYSGQAVPYGGRYPCGSLVYNSVWYYGTYCLMNEAGSLEPIVTTPTGTYNWGVLGPLVGFRTSTDFGKTWTETSHTPSNPLFPEPKRFGGPVKIGSPHFVDFGKNMQYSPDGKAYLVAHGASISNPSPRPASASWITGDCVYLMRFTPTPKNADDASQYEFFGGNDQAGNPVWTHDFARMKPLLLDWNNHLGCATITYDAPLHRYIMCVTDGGTTVGPYNTSILESKNITGSWRLSVYMRKFGTQGFFVNIPSKFISKNGRDVWLCYSANFYGPQHANPPGRDHGMTLQQVRLFGQSEKLSNPLDSPDNIARQATVTTSSLHRGYEEEGAIDGIVGGFPGDTNAEWATDQEREGASMRLMWDTTEAVDRIWLFDRPNLIDQVTSGVLVFSDGSAIKTGPLPDDAKRGLEVRFPTKHVRWVTFIVTGVKKETQNIGLSEFAVFRAR